MTTPTASYPLFPYPGSGGFTSDTPKLSPLEKLLAGRNKFAGRSVLCVVSGGMDSATVLAGMPTFWGAERVGAISFDYGQRHRKELGYAQKMAHRIDVPLFIIDITPVGSWLGGSALTDDIEVPQGMYDEENMRITVVPNRNMIMLSIAAGIAQARGYDTIATGIHFGDHAVYPSL